MTKHPYFYKAYAHTPSEVAKRIWFYVHAVGWFRCASDYDVRRDSFFGYQLKYVLRGCGYVEWEGHTYAVRAGEIFLLDLSLSHRYYADRDDPWELLWVHFDGANCSDYFHLLSAFANPVLRTGDMAETEAQFRELFTLFRHQPPGLEALASLAITHILTQLVVTRIQAGMEPQALPSPPYPDAIRHSIAYLEANYQNPLQLEEIAQQVTLSPFHFARLFKRATGSSVMEYLLRIRLRMAKHFLSQTAMPVNEIAEKCGFADPSYFSRTFKRWEGTTPSEYRHSRA
ncbi:MAG: AraC family transcriptional regulator [Firmicutes bacterium]|nr:AraC family transcriptional regulator [Bacillota bacterium]